MLIAALFTLAKLWKQPRCPTTDEWIKKMWHLYTMEFYSAMKKNEILPCASKWMELESIILSKVSQAQKTIIICSPSYADFRSRANTAMWLNLGYVISWEHIREVWRQIRNQKHDSILCPHCRGTNTETLKQQKSIWEGDQELVQRSVRDEQAWDVTYLYMTAMLGISLYSYPYLK
jgi:hypothetical protein